MEPDSPKQPNKVLIGIIIVVLLAAVTAAVVMLSGKKETPTDTTQDTKSTNKTDSEPSTSTGAPATPSASTGSYKDGSYEATGKYQTPGGTERVTVKVTLASGVIKTVDLERSPTTPEAQEYQGKFVSGYKAEVIGKNIDTVRLSRVAGSSLTSGGFNQALETIKNDARS